MNDEYAVNLTIKQKRTLKRQKDHHNIKRLILSSKDSAVNETDKIADCSCVIILRLLDKWVEFDATTEWVLPTLGIELVTKYIGKSPHSAKEVDSPLAE